MPTDPTPAPAAPAPTPTNALRTALDGDQWVAWSDNHPGLETAGRDGDEALLTLIYELRNRGLGFDPDVERPVLAPLSAAQVAQLGRGGPKLVPHSDASKAAASAKATAAAAVLTAEAEAKAAKEASDAAEKAAAKDKADVALALAATNAKAAAVRADAAAKAAKDAATKADADAEAAAAAAKAADAKVVLVRKPVPDVNIFDEPIGPPKSV
jgi:hypothetical protein